jgi:CBS domain-containing protein
MAPFLTNAWARTSDQSVVTSFFMNPALADVEKFLAATPPFDRLDPPLRQRAAAAIEAIYRRTGTVLLEIGDSNEMLYIIRRGAVEAHDRHGNLIDRYGEGESFGVQSLLTGKPVRFRITMIEDGLIWTMPRAAFDALRAASPEFETHYIRSLEERLIAGVQQAANSSSQELFMTPMGELVRREPVVVTPDTTIAAAARQMSKHGVSSLLVNEGDVVRGIVTDRDLRNRVLAKDRDPSQPVAEIMTTDLVTQDASHPVLEGIITMAGRGIHHLPLTRGGRVIGMLTTRDLMTLQTSHPLYLAAQIQKAASSENLISICKQVPRLFELMLASGLRAEQVPRVLTTINDAVTRRLIALAQQQLGPAPVPFAWLAFGSQARAEQSIGTDQDNGLVYADDAPAGADTWFAALARIVCDGLDACGYPYCPGQIMATTDDWRRPLAGWLEHFRNWSAVPDPQAVLRISIFFDLRAVDGDHALAERISQALGECGSGRNKGAFISALARQAASYDVPLGFFRRFVLAGKGEHRETLEIKASGLMPLTDLVRARALEAGVTVPGTQERISQMVATNVLGRTDADRLSGAHLLLMGMRVRLHAEQVRRGQKPHNHLDPREVSHAERAALREAFLVIREAQQGLLLDFPG